jgi:hypothetical protein
MRIRRIVMVTICSPRRSYLSACILVYFNSNLISILRPVLARLVKLINIETYC